MIKNIILLNTKSCKNQKGDFVDWYAIFLKPKSSTGKDLISYLYFDNFSNELKYYIYNEDTFPLNKILDYIINDDFGTNYIIWNDDISIINEKSKFSNKNKAHSKGILLYDSFSGLYLSHSIPKYPLRDNRNNILKEIPKNAVKYGQSLICISLSKSEAEIILKILININVKVVKSVYYDRVNIFSNLSLLDLITNEKNNNDIINYAIKIKSINFKEFNFILKNHKHKVIRFDTSLRKLYNDDFYVRIWSRPYLSEADAGKFYIKNIYNIKLRNYSIHVNKDHSKWAVSKNESIVCFSNLNHVESHKNRGGLIICFEEKILNKKSKEPIENK